MQLVGARVYSDDKAGRDVGEICGIGQVGVIATNDSDEIVALDADCVLYNPEGEWDPPAALDDVCKLLASGKNVVSTAVTAWIYPASAGEEVVQRLEAAWNRLTAPIDGHYVPRSTVSRLMSRRAVV